MSSKYLTVDDFQGTAKEEAVKEEPTKDVVVEDVIEKDNKPASEYLADSMQPKDIFTQLDSTIRDIHGKFKDEPYMAPVYQAAIQNIPFIDGVTKAKLAQGDTTNLKEVYGIPALHFINQYLFNYPRAIAQQMGLEYPEAETLPGQILSKSAGVAGGLKQLQTGTKLAGKIPGLGLKGSLAGPSKLNALRTAGQGAVAGGVQGAIISPEDPLDMKARAMQAGAGMFIGAALAPVSTKIANLIKKKNIRKLTQLKGRVGRKRADLDLARTQKNIQSDEFMDEAMGLVDQSRKELQDTVAQQQIRGKVPELKTATLKYGKDIGKLYEATVNEISDEIGASTGTSGAFDFFDDFLAQVEVDEGLKATTAYKNLQKNFVDKINDHMDFKRLNSLRHKVTKNKVFKGDMDDVVYTKFRQAFNDFAETVDTTGKFKELNKTMRPQLQFKHDFSKKINVYKPYETKGAESLVKKYAQRNLPPSQVKGEPISGGELDLMDHAMTYLNKYGVKVDDIEAIYSGKAKDAAKIVSVSNKLKAISKKGKMAEKSTTAIRDNIRKKQDIKLSEIDLAKSRKLLGTAINNIIRLSLAGSVFYGFNKLKDTMGMSDGGQTTNNYN